MKELELIQLYCYLCECYITELSVYCQRFSPNSTPSNQKITDVELLTIYFYCRRFEGKHKKSDIYDYACRYMKSWFPSLPNYANFNSRLNNLDSVVLSLLPLLIEYIDNEGIVKNIDSQIALIDSFPIILCSGKRTGKVAKEVSDKGFCSTKNLFYYGVKMHMVAQRVPGSIPLMNFISITSASENDLTAMRPILPKLAGMAIFADKAYLDAGLNQTLMKDQNTYIYTPVKLKKGQSHVERAFDKATNDLFSTAVSRVRQPVESLFNWINEKTGLQNAAKVRATKGLFIHLYGALVTALLNYIF